MQRPEGSNGDFQMTGQGWVGWVNRNEAYREEGSRHEECHLL